MKSTYKIIKTLSTTLLVVSMCSLMSAMTLDAKSAKRLKVAVVEEEGKEYFSVTGSSGHSMYAVKNSSYKIESDGVASVKVKLYPAALLPSSKSATGDFEVKIPKSDAVTAIVFGKEKRRIWAK